MRVVARFQGHSAKPWTSRFPSVNEANNHGPRDQDVVSGITCEVRTTRIESRTQGIQELLAPAVMSSLPDHVPCGPRNAVKQDIHARGPTGLPEGTTVEGDVDPGEGRVMQDGKRPAQGTSASGVSRPILVSCVAAAEAPHGELATLRSAISTMTPALP